jgi:hypothetical protein
MKRHLAIIGLLVSLLGVADARAASKMPPLPPAFTGHLFSQVGSPVPPSRRFRSGFEIAVEHGYEVQAFTFGTAVVLDVFRKHPHHMRVDTYYVARGVSTPQRLQATFGRYGKISMRFRSARSEAVRNRVICRQGRRFRQRRGLFVGNFRFKGEAGYVSVALHRAKGSVLTPAGRCPLSRKARERLREELISLFEPLAAIFATTRDGVDLTGFLTLKHRDKAGYLAVREETRGRLAIIRRGPEHQALPRQRSGDRGKRRPARPIPRPRPLPRRAGRNHHLVRQSLGEFPRRPPLPTHRPAVPSLPRSSVLRNGRVPLLK